MMKVKLSNLCYISDREVERQISLLEKKYTRAGKLKKKISAIVKMNTTTSSEKEN